MLIYGEIVALLVTIVLLHRTSSTPEDISVLESIDRLLSARPSHVPWIPSIAYETKPKTEYQQRQFIKDRLYEQQVELILADLQSQMMGTAEAQRFFVKASVYGMPSYDNLKFYDEFILSYDNRLKQPVWSLEHLTRSHFRHGYALRPPKRFLRCPDKHIHKLFRGHYQDYKCTYYTPIHFASTCNHKSNQKATNQLHRFTNTAPVAPDLVLWEQLEGYVAYLAARSINTYVVTGTLYKPPRGRKDLRYEVVGTSRIAVPTHYYKVILSENSKGYLSIEAFAIPNSSRVPHFPGLEQFRIDTENDLDNFENAAQLKFFNMLDHYKLIKPVIHKNYLGPFKRPYE